MDSMQKKPSKSVHTVLAQITHWRESQKGRFGFAEILTPDCPTKQAFFGISEHQTEPELNESFECSIKLVGGRWRVVRMASDEPPPVLELAGTVVELMAQGKRPAWKVQLHTAEGDVRFAQLSDKCLDAVHLLWLEPGAQISVRVALPAQGVGDVEALLTPTASSVLDPGSEHPAQGYLALAQQNWTVDGDKQPKAIRFALHVPGAKGWPSIWVTPGVLRSQGIRSVEKVSLAQAFNQQGAHEHLEHAALVLQTGDAEDMAELVIDVVRLGVKFDARQQRWSFQRLRAPLSLREPEEDGECVDWVQARVCGVEEQTPVNNKEDGLEPAAEKLTRPQATRVSMAINDPRLGRGEVKGFLPTESVRHAALEEGVQTIVRLVSKKTYWNIKALHRSTPKREGV